ncbi:hypothetical protein Palpr_2544 [Paludibacter propionicigenes WB4]|uniref:Uncharacterized protein n=1 Tax=Paludibacter propionicigenes (strain DSM 17365 / JCM 13257 / WB4) TaxID=694427 RepID=E4T7I2_PALPW|nr:hypothetical protein [Paludibacter propionicigenes]ADQ80676.1 hypothetical protein Palpr_2544 [Paludibacter propionicigenes WB4]
MTRSILRTVLIGILIGAIAFFVPKLLIGVILFCFIVHLLHCGMGCHGHYRGHRKMFYLADKIRQMSEEEYTEFKANMGGAYYSTVHHGHYGCCSARAHNKCCKSKKQPNN